MENTVCLDRSLEEKIGKNEEIRQLHGEYLSGKATEETHKIESEWWQGLFFHGDIWEEVWCPSVWNTLNEDSVDVEGYPSSLEIPLSSIILWIENQVIFFPSSLLAGTKNTFYSHRLIRNRLVSGSKLLKLRLYLLIVVIQLFSYSAFNLSSTQVFWRRISGNFKYIEQRHRQDRRGNRMALVILTYPITCFKVG